MTVEAPVKTDARERKGHGTKAAAGTEQRLLSSSLTP